MITGKFPNLRLRRSRKYSWSRRLIQENNLSANDLIYPIFLIDGKNTKQPIKTMPGIYRYTIDQLGKVITEAIKNRIPMIALFPSISKKKKIISEMKLRMKITLFAEQLNILKKDLKMILELCVMLLWTLTQLMDMMGC